MSDLNSLTKVTKEELEIALKSWEEQREEDKATYKQRLEKWANEFEFTWWQCNVKKLHLLPAEELLMELHGRPYIWYGSSYVPREVKEALGLWDESFRYTLDRFGATWRNIAMTLVASGKDGHLVCSDVLSWVNRWRDNNV